MDTYKDKKFEYNNQSNNLSETTMYYQYQREGTVLYKIHYDKEKYLHYYVKKLKKYSDNISVQVTQG